MLKKIAFSTLFVLSRLVFADVENAENLVSDVVSEKDTNHYTLSVGYSGLGLNAFFHRNWIKHFTFSDEKISKLFITAGYGAGLVEEGLIAASADIQLGIPLSNSDIILIPLGLNPRLSLEEMEFITYIGVLYKQWLFNLGYSISTVGDNSFANSFSLSLNVGYLFKSITDKKIEEEKIEEKKPAENNEKPEKTKEPSARYFRPGIEFNYLIYRSKIEIFENSFPYTAIGAGLFFRIGPEYFYFTTGAYAQTDALYKEGIAKADFGIFGINIASVPLLDLTWGRLFVEVPLLLSFGSGQIRFTGGALLDFYAAGEVDITVNEKIPGLGGQTLISANDAKKIEERFNDVPDGNLYWVLGLDIDVVRHWGIGVKCLIWGGSFGESEAADYNIDTGIEPPRFQTRISTYLVF
ncbi:MAG: hypothetical protein FWF67_07275 [Fibromonadales bacterium]|nr:hypothetical protein [Fibromonadales bacterium]